MQDTSSKETEIVCGTGDIDRSGELHRLALVLGLCASKLVQAGLDQVRNLVHNPSALDTASLGPSLESLGGGGEGEVDVLFGRVGDLGMRDATSGVECVKVVAMHGLDMLVVDEVVESCWRHVDVCGCERDRG